MKIALTFDDGPNDPYTFQILGILASRGIKATFFMVGKFVLQCPDIVRQVRADGHWVGNHTVTHPKLTELPTMSQVASEICECERILDETIGEHSGMFRPPFMLTSPAIERVVAARGLKTVLFHAAAGDGGEQLGADHFVEKIKRELNGQSGIVLMHDGGHEAMGTNRQQTFDAVWKLINYYEDAEFVSPLELI